MTDLRVWATASDLPGGTQSVYLTGQHIRLGGIDPLDIRNIPGGVGIPPAGNPDL